MSQDSSKVAVSRLPIYERILVGYDGSENSRRALARAATIAHRGGGSLRVVVVVDTNLLAFAPMAPPIPSEVFDDLIKNGKDLMSQAMDAVASLVPGVSGTVEEGNPAEAILDLASKDNTNLIVVGRRGLSRVERFLLGGVSSTVMSHSMCDVLVVM